MSWAELDKDIFKFDVIFSKYVELVGMPDEFWFIISWSEFVQNLYCLSLTYIWLTIFLSRTWAKQIFIFWLVFDIYRIKIIFLTLYKFNVTSIVLISRVEPSIFSSLNTSNSSFEPSRAKHSFAQALIFCSYTV